MLHVLDTGSGPTLVLIHGLSAWHHQFDALMPHLDEWRTLAVDMPGFGLSDAPEHPLTLAEVADIVHSEIASRGVERYRLVGHSMGAAVAVAVAERHPDSIERLILLAPAGLITWKRSKPAHPALVGVRSIVRQVALRSAQLLAGSGRLRKIMLARLVHDPAALSASDARLLLEGARRGQLQALNQARDELAGAVISEHLADLAMPVELVWGTQDRLVPIRWASVLLEKRPDMHLETIDEAGHVLTMEYPQQVSAAITRAAWQARPTIERL